MSLRQVKSSFSVTSDGSSSTRYRTIALGSSIDESLFGPKRNRNERRKKVTKNLDNDISYTSIRITTHDLERLKSPQNSLDEEVNGESNLKSRAVSRKEYMLSLDRQMKEKELQDQQGMHGFRMEQVRLRAAQLSDKDKDIVKMLDSCRQRAAAFAIRDEQLRDKEEKMRKEREYEKMTDLAMEVDRLKELAKRETQEKIKLQKRFADRMVVEKQIQERNHLKLLQDEAREQENQIMLEEAKKIAIEAQISEQKRRDDARLAHLEALQWNEHILAEKQKMHEQEKQEEALLLAYQASRDEALRKRDDDEREAIRKKQELQKKLLESQTRVLNKQADLDELRSRRAFEEKERRYRQQQLEEHRKRKSEMMALVEACRQQQIEKHESAQREKDIKEQEYQDALKWNRKMVQREHLEALEIKKKNDELRNMLLEQIREKEEKDRKEREEKFQEGKRIREANLIERYTIEKIRDEIVQDMRLKGVHEKYCGELLSMDVEKCLMR